MRTSFLRHVESLRLCLISIHVSSTTSLESMFYGEHNKGSDDDEETPLGNVQTDVNDFTVESEKKRHAAK